MRSNIWGHLVILGLEMFGCVMAGGFVQISQDMTTHKISCSLKLVIFYSFVKVWSLMKLDVRVARHEVNNNNNNSNNNNNNTTTIPVSDPIIMISGSTSFLQGLPWLAERSWESIHFTIIPPIYPLMSRLPHRMISAAQIYNQVKRYIKIFWLN